MCMVRDLLVEEACKDNRVFFITIGKKTPIQKLSLLVWIPPPLVDERKQRFFNIFFSFSIPPKREIPLGTMLVSTKLIFPHIL